MKKLKIMNELEKFKFQLNHNYLYDLDQLDLILNPHQNIIFYQYLKSIGIVNESKYAIKLESDYFPKLFDSFEDAEKFAILSDRNENLTMEDETLFRIMSKFSFYTIEKI